MNLTPREKDKLLVAMAAIVARAVGDVADVALVAAGELDAAGVVES